MASFIIFVQQFMAADAYDADVCSQTCSLCCSWSWT